MTDLKKIREEFDKEFGACRALILPNGTREYTPRHNKIADFFLQKLADHDREIVEMLEKMKDENAKVFLGGKNEQIDKIIEKLKERK